MLVALWALTIMSFAILGVAKIVSIRMDEDFAAAKEGEAEELALSGMALALNPNVRPGESILQQTLDSGGSFNTQLNSEGARLQINWVLADKTRLQILERLFNLWGLSPADADTVIDCLADWVDADDIKRLNGAESAEYTAMGKSGYPPNRPFQSVEEMSLVKNIDLLEKAKPDWRNYFTVWSDAKLDLNEATPDLIYAVCGISLSQAQAMVKTRNGDDGLPGTSDDVRYSDINQAQAALGLSQQSFQSIAGYVSVDSTLKRIISTGKVGKYQKTISVVVRVNNQTIQYLEWLEH